MTLNFIRLSKINKFDLKIKVQIPNNNLKYIFLFKLNFFIPRASCYIIRLIQSYTPDGLTMS